MLIDLLMHYIDITETVQESKLFVGMLPTSIEESHLSAMFSPYGEVSEIYVMRDTRNVSKVRTLAHPFHAPVYNIVVCWWELTA